MATDIPIKRIQNTCILVLLELEITLIQAQKTSTALYTSTKRSSLTLVPSHSGPLRPPIVCLSDFRYRNDAN